MSALIPLWVLFVVMGVMAVLSVVIAVGYGRWREKRMAGDWDLIKPVHDLTLRPYGPRRHFFVETFHDGRVYFPAEAGKYHMVKNNGVFGWFGGKTEKIDKDELIEVDGIYFYGRTQFEQAFNLKQTVLQRDVDHWKEQAMQWQALAEQHRHDPQSGVEQATANLMEVARAGALMVPKTKSTQRKS